MQIFGDMWPIFFIMTSNQSSRNVGKCIIVWGERGMNQNYAHISVTIKKKRLPVKIKNYLIFEKRSFPIVVHFRRGLDLTFLLAIAIWSMFFDKVVGGIKSIINLFLLRNSLVIIFSVQTFKTETIIGFIIITPILFLKLLISSSYHIFERWWYLLHWPRVYHNFYCY